MSVLREMEDVSIFVSTLWEVITALAVMVMI